MLLYVQPQHQDVDLSTPACLDKFAVGTLLLSLGTHVLATSVWHFGQNKLAFGVSFIWRSGGLPGKETSVSLVATIPLN